MTNENLKYLRQFCPHAPGCNCGPVCASLDYIEAEARKSTNNPTDPWGEHRRSPRRNPRRLWSETRTAALTRRGG